MSKITDEQWAESEVALVDYIRSIHPVADGWRVEKTEKNDPVDVKVYRGGRLVKVYEGKLRNGRVLEDGKIQFINRYNVWCNLDSVFLEDRKAQTLLDYDKQGVEAYFVTQWGEKAIVFRVTPTNISKCGWKQSGGRTQQPRGGELPDPVFLVYANLWAVMQGYRGPAPLAKAA